MDSFEKYIGQVIDKRYKLNKVIGIGGMAVVFEAQDLVLKRAVAVKMIKDEIARDTPTVKRFINESKAVSMLSHPNIVSIYDVSVRDDLKYIVMEYVAGITLKNYMEKKGALSFKETMSYTEQILRALEHAHSKGIIHRDIKPQNIMLLKNGRIKVTDFGIAKLPNAETVTMTDKAIGTVYYISPEQASGKPIDQRSDLYSLGVLMYEMATGVLPFNAENPVSVALMQVNDKPRRPRELNPDIPVGLEQIILGAMEKSPEHRFQSAGQLLRHIEQLKSNPHFVFKTRRDESQALVPGGGTELYGDARAATGQISITSGKNSGKNKRPGKKRSESHSMLPIITGVTAAFLIVIGISGVYLLDTFLKSEEQSSPYIVTVPSLEGNLIDGAEVKALDDKIFKVEITNEYSDDYISGTIISQDPAAGEKRKVKSGEQYCTIKLTVSRGAETVKLPDYTGQENRTVDLSIRALGLIPEAKYEFSASMELGYVIRTDPNPRTELKIGDTVVYYISRGPEDAGKVSVPNFVGMTAAAAYQTLVGSDATNPLLSLGKVTYEASDTVAKGLIISQSLDPEGEQVPRGTKVNFVVSNGPSPKTTNPETEAETTAANENKPTKHSR
jgi:Serine/threonine protein kinase